MKLKYIKGAFIGLFVGIGSLALAESVELISHDGGVAISGEIIGFDGGLYTLQTTMGNLIVDASQVKCVGSSCPVIASATPLGGAVELISLDGNVTLSGKLIGFDGSTYTLQTILGDLFVDALQVQCLGASCPAVATGAPFIRVSGDPSVTVGLVPRLLSEFSNSIGGETLSIASEGSEDVLSVHDASGEKVLDMALIANQATHSLNDLLKGRANIAILTRPINALERSTFLDAGLGDLATPEQQVIFGLDGIVIVAAESNPIRALSKQALAQVFSGEITNWSQIGGPKAQINLFVSAEDTGTGALFNANIMVPEGKAFSPQATIVESDQEVVARVAADPLAIGFSALSSVENAKILDIRDACGIQIPATSFTIKTEEYPLTKRLYVYSTNVNRPPQLTRFLDFLAEDAAQKAVTDSGLVNLGVSYQSNNEQGLRYLAAMVQADDSTSIRELRDMTNSLLDSDRLSLTLRFALGSSQLDDRARDDIQRLVRHITTNDLVNKELLLVGFTDNIGNANGNVILSRQRADSAYQSLLEALPEGGADGLPIKSVGFGELSPLSCNNSPNGRRINRRVEVWLRDTISISN